MAGDKFMSEMHLRQPGFMFIACGPFTKNKTRVQKFKETEDSRYIFRNEIDKVCFQHDKAYGTYKYLPRRTVSDKVLHKKKISILVILSTTDIRVNLHQ